MAPSTMKLSANGVKRGPPVRPAPADSHATRPAKRAKLLGDSDDEDDDPASGVSLKVNEEYARRFEHNKEREEQHRCMHDFTSPRLC